MFLLPRCQRLEGSRLPNSVPRIAASCPFVPSLWGSSTVPILVATSSAATGKWSPPYTATLSISVFGHRMALLAACFPSVRVGALGAESRQNPYAIVQRRDLPTTTCCPYGGASSMPVGQHSSCSSYCNISQSRPVRPSGVKDDICDGGGGPISPIEPPPPPRSPT